MAKKSPPKGKMPGLVIVIGTGKPPKLPKSGRTPKTPKAL